MTTAVYFRKGDTYSVADNSKIDMVDQLPPGNYMLTQDPMGNYHFERTDDFSLPPKLYGDVERTAARIMFTFHDRESCTGVLLSGEQGSGKTMLAKKLSLLGAAEGMPTVLINAPWVGESFNSLVQSMKQDCIFLFDEFEKVYDQDKQKAMLTLMDGTFASKKLFILTCNDKFKVDRFMRNRPGRLYYAIDYVGLSADFIRDYCADALANPKWTDQIVSAAAVFTAFNFDMLKALVEEVNRYDEAPVEALSMLNIQPQYDSSESEFDVQIELKDGAKIQRFWPEKCGANPLTRPKFHFGMDVLKKTAPKKLAVVGSDGLDDLLEDDEDSVELEFGQEALLKMDAEAGVFVYETDLATVTFKRRKAEAFRWGRALDASPI